MDRAHILQHTGETTYQTASTTTRSRSGSPDAAPLQREHDANGAAVARPEMDMVLTLESPMQ